MTVHVFIIEQGNADDPTETLVDVYASFGQATAAANQLAQDLFNEAYDVASTEYDLRTAIVQDSHVLISIIDERRATNEQDVEWWRVRSTPIKGAEDLTSKLTSML